MEEKQKINRAFGTRKVFNFDLERMKKHVESETIEIPNYATAEEIEQWLLTQ